MKAEVLSGPYCLTHEQPGLWQPVETGQEGGKKRKALNVCELGAGVVDNVEHHGPLRDGQMMGGIATFRKF